MSRRRGRGGYLRDRLSSPRGSLEERGGRDLSVAVAVALEIAVARGFGLAGAGVVVRAFLRLRRVLFPRHLYQYEGEADHLAFARFYLLEAVARHMTMTMTSKRESIVEGRQC